MRWRERAGIQRIETSDILQLAILQRMWIRLGGKAEAIDRDLQAKMGQDFAILGDQSCPRLKPVLAVPVKVPSLKKSAQGQWMTREIPARCGRAKPAILCRLAYWIQVFHSDGVAGSRLKRRERLRGCSGPGIGGELDG